MFVVLGVLLTFKIEILVEIGIFVEIVIFVPIALFVTSPSVSFLLCHLLKCFTSSCVLVMSCMIVYFLGKQMWFKCNILFKEKSNIVIASYDQNVVLQILKKQKS